MFKWVYKVFNHTKRANRQKKGLVYFIIRIILFQTIIFKNEKRKLTNNLCTI